MLLTRFVIYHVPLLAFYLFWCVYGTVITKDMNHTLLGSSGISAPVGVCRPASSTNLSNVRFYMNSAEIIPGTLTPKNFVVACPLLTESRSIAVPVSSHEQLSFITQFMFSDFYAQVIKSFYKDSME